MIGLPATGSRHGAPGTTEPLRWGILGAAAIARRAVVPAIRSAGDEVVAVGSRRPQVAEALAEDLGAGAVYASYDAVLQDSRVEAVYISLPNDLHCRWTIAAARAGKHVLCEKPLALDAAQARSMVNACREAGVVLAEAVFFRHHPRLARIRQMLAEGVIGRVAHVEASFSYCLADRPNIRWQADMGGGALYDLGSHVISLVRLILGGDPVRASAVMRKRRGVDAATAATLMFADGVTAGCFVSFESAQYQSLVVVGETGVLHAPRPISAWLVGGPIPGPAHPVIIQRDAGHTVMPGLPPINPYEEMVKSFKRSVRNGEPALVGGEEGTANLRVIDACRRSAASGRCEAVI
jgi:xylose dehydrogenase (NAD/NADP)